MKVSETIPKPFLFDLKRYSINDGPGIRLTVFFKGCPLSCRWCHNPESHSFSQEKLYNRSKCIACLSCIQECPEDALTWSADEGIVTDGEKCTVCGRCAQVCPTRAIEISGRHYGYDEIMRAILREKDLLESSGGGVTFSGGEPLMFPEALGELLIRCGKAGIHRAVDTSGHAKRSSFEMIMPHTDLFLYDLKHMNTHVHRQWTGVPNDFILDNLRYVASQNKPYHIRIPLVKGVNTDVENIRATAGFVAGLPYKPDAVGLLPYHAIAEIKYEKLGRSYRADGMSEPEKELVTQISHEFTKLGLVVLIGG